MDWVTGIHRAIDYMEAHITEDIDYAAAARQSCSSEYHFGRVFAILCGMTPGEYVRCRRLSLAGAALADQKIRVIDAALQYGYDSPDSFTRAFTRFHGITPSEARAGGVLKSFSRLHVRMTLEGGTTMNYRLEEKPETVYLGCKRHFSGTPDDRQRQEADFFISTRANQYLLKGMAHDCDTQYCIITGIDGDGYDFYIASRIGRWLDGRLEEELGADAGRFERIVVPGGTYLVCETERTKFPTMLLEDLRRRTVSEWLPSSDYELADAPELTVIHWYFDENAPEVSSTRYIELWLPVRKR